MMTIRKIMPSGMYRTGMLETWFHDMSLEGLHVNEFGYYIAAFDKGEPKDIRYSMDIMAKDPGKDELQVFSDCGWEQVSFRRDVHLFKTDGNSGARPLHTDKTDRELSIRKLERKMNRGVAVQLVLLILVIISMIYILMYDKDSFLTFLERGTSSLTSYFVLFLILTVRSYEEFAGIRELGRHLRGEEEQKTEWKQPMRLRKGYVAALAVILIFAISVTLYEITDTGVRAMDGYPASKDILRLSDIETRNDLFSENEQNLFYYQPRSVLADSMFTGSEKMWSIDGYGANVSLFFYDLRFQSASQRVIEGWEYRMSKGGLRKINDPFLDYLSIEEMPDGCYVFASKGDLVLVVMYTGDESHSLVASTVSDYLDRIDGTRK